LNNFISTKEASEWSGLTRKHIALLFRRGAIQGQKMTERNRLVYG